MLEIVLLVFFCICAVLLVKYVRPTHTVHSVISELQSELKEMEKMSIRSHCDGRPRRRSVRLWRCCFMVGTRPREPPRNFSSAFVGTRPREPPT